MIFRLNPEKANEGRGSVVPPFVIPVDAGIQGNDSLFVGVFKVSKNGISTAGSKAFARMTASPPLCHARPDRASRTMSPYFGGAVTPLIPKKRHSCCLDPRIRKDDGRRGVAGGVLFRVWGRLSFLKNGINAPWMLAFASMTAEGCVAGWDKLSRTVVPPLSSPSKLDPRVQGDDSLFLQCVNVNKSGTRLLNAHIRKDDGGANLKHTPI